MKESTSRDEIAAYLVMDDDELVRLMNKENDLTALSVLIVRRCPSLTHLLLAIGSKPGRNPLDGLN